MADNVFLWLSWPSSQEQVDRGDETQKAQWEGRQEWTNDGWRPVRGAGTRSGEEERIDKQEHQWFPFRQTLRKVAAS